MTDRELLERAAKAAGIQVWTDCDGNLYTDDGEGTQEREWNPLTSDADAFRLSVDLNLTVMIGMGMAGDITTICFPPELDMESISERHVSDKHAATRRAITRAAAAIGEQK